MSSIQPFSSAQLEALCKTLADTSEGLTGSQIGHILAQISVEDTDPNSTKWKRLYNALANRQNIDKSGNKIFSFISQALAPARYQGKLMEFQERCTKINVTLSYLGYEFHEDGKFHKVTSATTISEAEAKAGKLRSELQKRNVHPAVIQFCRSELLVENYFHSVLEASKSVAQKIRDKSGCTTDGSVLVDEAFGIGKKAYPILAFNSLETESEQSEHKGLMNLMKGFFGAFRNPTAHAPRISWQMTEQDALDILTVASLLHRRLDSVVKTGS